jgi:hypothetical protein
MRTEKIHKFLLSPITWGVVGLIIAAIAFSGMVSMNISYILLFLAFLVGCFGIFRIGKRIVIRIIWCLLLGIGLALIAYWIKPNLQIIQPVKTPVEADSIHQPKTKSPISKRPMQRDSIKITAFDSKSEIVFYNSGYRNVFVSHLSLRSKEFGYSGVILINEIIEGKKILVHNFKTPTNDFNKFSTRSFTESFWQKFLLKWHLNENECIQWHFFILDDPGYQTIKIFLGSSFHAVPIDATLYFRSIREGQQNSQDLNIFAVPFVNLTGSCGVMLQ